MIARIQPQLAAEQVFPANTAFMARTDLEQIRLTGGLAFNLDTITAHLLGVLNGLPTVRHRCGVTDGVLALFDRAGIEVKEDIRAYDAAEEAERIADELIEAGYKLLWPYPLREGRFPDSAHLVPPALWRRLNAKGFLDQIAPPDNLARRRVVPRSELDQATFEGPVYLKMSAGPANGSGFAVRVCTDETEWAEAVAWFAALEEAEGVVIEEALQVERCWCVAIAVSADRTTYCGAAEQLFSAPSKQSGSMIDAAHPLPEAGAALAVSVGEAARTHGFIGLAGLDIGLVSDGRLVVFDPNFRFNASSSQVLLHGSAAARGGFSASASMHTTSARPFAELARRMHGPIDDGWFVPIRLADAAFAPPVAEGQSVCTGFTLGRDRAEALARAEELQRILGG